MDMKLRLAPAAHRGLLQQIQADVALLERCHVMDYSMLLGVQFSAWEASGEWHPPEPPGARVGPPPHTHASDDHPFLAPLGHFGKLC